VALRWLVIKDNKGEGLLRMPNDSRINRVEQGLKKKGGSLICQQEAPEWYGKVCDLNKTALS